jgi:hypothetical protein
MEEIRVALSTPDDCVPVRLEALTPPAHACIPRVDLFTPPLIGPGQGTPHQSTPPMHAPPRTPCAAVDGPSPTAAWRLWRLTAGSPTEPLVCGRAMTRGGESHELVLTSEPRVGEERVRSRHPGEAPCLLHGRAGRPREAKTTGELVGL